MVAVFSPRNELVQDFLPALSFQSMYGSLSPHGDGYGVAFFREETLHVRKEVEAVWNHRTLFSDNDRGNILIMHSRKATMGDRKIDHVHPFSSHFDGKDYVFCHNGRIGDFEDHPEWIDSRQYFEWMMKYIPMDPDFPSAIRLAIKELLQHVTDFSSLNAYFSDGHTLAAIRVCPPDDYYHSLFWKQDPEGRTVITTERWEYFPHVPWSSLSHQHMLLVDASGARSVKLNG
ncbi:MAG TPA: class II glutamine amidotransferase [Thermotogota bacterium]|nr:class II glutamine amidotransferase [Thermotogota bacterium]